MFSPEGPGQGGHANVISKPLPQVVHEEVQHNRCRKLIEDLLGALGTWEQEQVIDVFGKFCPNFNPNDSLQRRFVHVIDNLPEEHFGFMEHYIHNLLDRRLLDDDWSSGTLDAPVVYVEGYREGTRVKVRVLLGEHIRAATTYPSPKPELSDARTLVWEGTADGHGGLDIDYQKHHFLFYEAEADRPITDTWEDAECVAKNDVVGFLEEILRNAGLDRQKTAYFIAFWLPKLTQKDYVLIKFLDLKELELLAKLEITPPPERLLRVFMVFKAIDERVSTQPRALPQGTASGESSVIEWGGSEQGAHSRA